MSQRGRFISLEGIEGAGKTTLVRALQTALEARGVRTVLTREPGGTALAERLRQIALERGSERIDPTAETLIMFAARAIHLDNLIRPTLAAGHWVLCDRFTDATYLRTGSCFPQQATSGSRHQLTATLAASPGSSECFSAKMTIAQRC